MEGKKRRKTDRWTSDRNYIYTFIYLSRTSETIWYNGVCVCVSGMVTRVDSLKELQIYKAVAFRWITTQLVTHELITITRTSF